MRVLVTDLSHDDVAKVENALACPFDVVVGPEKSRSARCCTGCFGCWLKTPGVCVIPDGLRDMGPLFAAADELWIVSDGTFGSLSFPVKKALDRALGYLHPYFEIRNQEMHHRRRHENILHMHVLAYGCQSALERDAVQEIAQANALNYDADLREVSFFEDDRALIEGVPLSFSETDTSSREPGDVCRTADVRGKVLLIGASPKAKGGATGDLLTLLASDLESRQIPVERMSCRNEREARTMPRDHFDAVVLGFPLYVDALPSHVVALVSSPEFAAAVQGARVYAVSNCGFYEGRQISPAFAVLRNACDALGAHWSGGVMVGAGGMIEPTQAVPWERWPKRRLSSDMNYLAAAIAEGRPCGSKVSGFPVTRTLYRITAEAYWRRVAKENKVPDLNARPTVHLDARDSR